MWSFVQFLGGCGGERFLWAGKAFQHSSDAGHAHGALCEVWQGVAGARTRAVEGRTWQTRVRKRLQGPLEAVDRAFENDHERIPAESAGSQFPENNGRTTGAVFLWRRGKATGRLRRAKSEGLSRPTSLAD